MTEKGGGHLMLLQEEFGSGLLGGFVSSNRIALNAFSEMGTEYPIPIRHSYLIKMASLRGYLE